MGFLLQRITITSCLAPHPGLKQHVSMPLHVVIQSNDTLPGMNSSLQFGKALVVSLYTKPKIFLHVSSFHVAFQNHVFST